jgi:hypothetical protein
MRYLCLVHFEPAAMEAMSPREQALLTNDSIAYDEKLAADGRYITSQALQPASETRTVRVRNGKVSTTTGPFAETREVLAGFILIEAKDWDDALDAAAGIPLARLGTVEVRPIMPLSKTEG